MSCSDGEAWSTCRSQRCISPAMPEDLCADGSEPVANIESISSPAMCAERGLPAGAFAERCSICTAIAREALAAARRRVDGGALGLCSLAANAVIAVELPTFRTCRLDPDRCTDFVAELTTSICPQIASLIEQGAGRTTVLREAQRFCGDKLHLRHNTTVVEATVCEAPRDMGMRVMTISATIAAMVLAAQLAPPDLITF